VRQEQQQMEPAHHFGFDLLASTFPSYVGAAFRGRSPIQPLARQNIVDETQRFAYLILAPRNAVLSRWH
jgi:hypothetical protein